MPVIVTVGDLMVDVSVLTEGEIDEVSDTPSIVAHHRGGSAANVAAVSARLGRPARFVGVRAADMMGEWMASELASLGVEAAGPAAMRSGCIVVLVDHLGQRRFLTDRGDRPVWTMDPVWLDGAERLHLTGYALCDPTSGDACEALALEARRRGVPVSVDPSSVSVLEAFGVARFIDLLVDLDPDVILPNADEVRLLTAAIGGRAWVVTTNGPDPTWVISPNGASVEVAVPPVAILDTTGAGDAFAAGFLAGLDALGAGRDAWSLDVVAAAATGGHHAAARVVGGVGADAWED